MNGSVCFLALAITQCLTSMDEKQFLFVVCGYLEIIQRYL